MAEQMEKLAEVLAELANKARPEDVDKMLEKEPKGIWYENENLKFWNYLKPLDVTEFYMFHDFIHENLSDQANLFTNAIIFNKEWKDDEGRIHSGMQDRKNGQLQGIVRTVDPKEESITEANYDKGKPFGLFRQIKDNIVTLKLFDHTSELDSLVKYDRKLNFLDW